MERTPVPRSYPQGRGALPSWEASLNGPNIDAKVRFSEEGWQEEFLADFLSKLAPAWRGWTGVRTWRSAESELQITAKHNGMNTVTLMVDLAVGSPHQWRVTAGLDLDPGMLEAIGVDARRLSDNALQL